MQKMHIVITTAGTSGDAIPFVAIGKELIARGYKVTLMTSRDHEMLARKNGLDFMPTGDADMPQIGRDERAFFRDQLFPAYVMIEKHIATLRANGEEVFGVVRVGNWGGLMACERHQLPFVIMVPQPASIWGYGQPICDEDRVLVNNWRHSIGLHMVTGYTIPEPAILTIGLFPDWFGFPDTERMPRGICTGFPFLDSDQKVLPPEIESFIENYGPPVVFTAGTGVQDIEKFAGVAREFQRKTDRPVIFLSHYCKTIGETENTMFRVLPFLDHRLLFPSAAMVVHNGGIGVIAQAIRAAVPQLVVPLVWDQPDNRDRIEALGIGCGIELADLSATGLQLALEHFETMDRKPLHLAAAAVRGENAASLCADQIESAIAKPLKKTA
ncbi:MAG: hypothetical protein HC843_07930 [Sphingomonadales bacterium]|nr:hypothetical protein [Sphingomonadales bacterium]